ncbi:MAG TPA: elongation factor G [Termitinemataceae bacterium]|nr:elongation factor G [Termitinemataceae bacterium]HOM22712.1 elongation factor G [Termitinemataceae bacterium]HPP99551.1 elongation factor G [Termitinemataceae bacterium]
MSYTTDLVKNVSLAGHGGTGKTSLFERLLFAGGVIPKPETIESGKTVSDSSPEEIERKISIYTALGHVEWKGKKINIFDTPGSSDFVGEVISALRATELCIAVVDGRAGVQIETLKLWRTLNSRGKPRGIYITKMDDDRSDFEAVLEDIKEKLKIDPFPFFLPMGKGSSYRGVIDVLNERAYFVQEGGLEKEGPIPAEYQDQVRAMRERLIEAAAEGDDTLMEHYVDKGSLDAEEMHLGLIEALAEHKYVPVFCGSALKNSGIIPFIDIMADIAPDPRTARDLVQETSGEEWEVEIDPNKPFAGLVVKTVFDQFSGKLSWVKVFEGKLSADSEILNVRENKKERIGKLYLCQGKKLEEVRELYAGDVGIITKVTSLHTNDSITDPASPLLFVPLKLPEPVHMVAVHAAQKKDEDKLGEFLLRATEEDKTLRYEYNTETKEAIIGGMGELHIAIVLDKIRNNQKIEIETRPPRVAYRETITKKANAEYTHKKQTGGHGQYARVVLDIEPLPRGENYKFINAIFGGAISKGYIPGVEKGVLEAMQHGVMAGYPVVDVQVTVVDGKEHPVDSSELAFKLAARNAFKEAMKKASPTLLEPIMNLTVFVEEKYLGDIMSDLSGKRGKILGQNSIGGGIEEIRAQVPQAELLRYSIDLRSMTSGTGSFSVEFDHYAPISGKIAEEVIKAAEAFRVQESEE